MKKTIALFGGRTQSSSNSSSISEGATDEDSTNQQLRAVVTRVDVTMVGFCPLSEPVFVF